MTTTRIKLLCVLAALGTAFGAAIIHAPEATADQNDFVKDLDAHGIYYRDINGVIKDATIICGELRGHENVGQIITQAQNEGGFPGQAAPLFIMDAATNMCPDVLPWLQEQANTAAPRRLNANE